MGIIKKNAYKVSKVLIKNSVKRDANSTTCIFTHQPKVPSELKKFSKIYNVK